MTAKDDSLPIQSEMPSIPAPVLIRGCMEGLQWSWEVPLSVSIDKLVLGLRERGFRDQSQFDWVWELVDGKENKVVIVPKTRRVQIRVHYLIEKAKRELVAWQIALFMHEACSGKLEQNQ